MPDRDFATCEVAGSRGLIAMATNWHDRLQTGQRTLAERGVRQVARLPGYRRHHDTVVEAERKRHCLLDRTSTKAMRADRAQTKLSAYIRPVGWNGDDMLAKVDADALGLVVRALLVAHDARTVRALACACRACAEAVRQTLLAVRTQLREAADAYWSARVDWVSIRDMDPEFPEFLNAEGREHHAATLKRCTDAYDRYDACMRANGIHEYRRDALTARVGQRWFHDAKSVLGHVASGCELCAEPLAEDTFGAGPVALFACAKCAHANRVRFTLHPDEERAKRLRKPTSALPVLARFPRTDRPANNYACALLSKRETHRRRMKTDRAAVARRAVPLSRRVHRQKWTNGLHAAWIDYGDEDDVEPDPDAMDFELWHALPPGIPAELGFAPMMDAHVADGTRAEADACGTVRRRARAATDARRHKYNKLLEKHDSTVSVVNRVIQNTGYFAWVQVLDLVCAAHAFELRWMFRASQSRFGDWRRARYRLLDIEPHALRVGTKRVRNVAFALTATLTDANLPLDSNCPTRACVLEIAKHLPDAFLDGDWESLHAVVQHLRSARITLRVAATRPRLYIDVAINPRILRRPALTLEVVLTQYVINQLHGLVYDSPPPKALGWEVTGIVESMANQMSTQCWAKHVAHPSYSEKVLTPGRDKVRAALFRLPGAWPCARLWFKDQAPKRPVG